MDAEDEPMPPSRHNFKREPEPEPEPSKSVVYHAVPEPITFGMVKRQDTFDMIKKRTPRVFPAPPQQAKPLVVEKPPDFEVDVEVANTPTVPYTMKFISLDGGRTWFEAYKTTVQVRQFKYGEQTLWLPLLRYGDARDMAYGELYPTSDKAIKSILYKKVNAKELLDVVEQPHTQ